MNHIKYQSALHLSSLKMYASASPIPIQLLNDIDVQTVAISQPWKFNCENMQSVTIWMKGLQ